MAFTYLISILFWVGYFVAAICMLRGIHWNARALCISGLMIALTVILESIYIPLPTGSALPLFSPVPLMVLSLLYDPKVTIISGWVCGFLVMLFVPGWQPIHWGQIFMEHMIAFSCLGFTGIFGTKNRWRIILGVLLASLLKTITHILSGVLFFSQNAWDGWGAWMYSVLYNLSSNLPLCLLSGLIVVSLPLRALKQFAGTEGRK